MPYNTSIHFVGASKRLVFALLRDHRENREIGALGVSALGMVSVCTENPEVLLAVRWHQYTFEIPAIAALIVLHRVDFSHAVPSSMAALASFL